MILPGCIPRLISRIAAFKTFSAGLSAEEGEGNISSRNVTMTLPAAVVRRLLLSTKNKLSENPLPILGFQAPFASVGPIQLTNISAIAIGVAVLIDLVFLELWPGFRTLIPQC